MIAAFLIGSYFNLAHMDRNKEKLNFNTPVNRQFAYASSARETADLLFLPPRFSADDSGHGIL